MFQGTDQHTFFKSTFAKTVPFFLKARRVECNVVLLMMHKFRGVDLLRVVIDLRAHLLEVLERLVWEVVELAVIRPLLRDPPELQDERPPRHDAYVYSNLFFLIFY